MTEAQIKTAASLTTIQMREALAAQGIVSFDTRDTTVKGEAVKLVMDASDHKAVILNGERCLVGERPTIMRHTSASAGYNVIETRRYMWPPMDRRFGAEAGRTFEIEGSQ